jgi:hypothetical protein
MEAMAAMGMVMEVTTEVTEVMGMVTETTMATVDMATVDIAVKKIIEKITK